MFAIIPRITPFKDPQHFWDTLYTNNQIWSAEPDVRSVVICVRIRLRSEVQSLTSGA